MAEQLAINVETEKLQRGLERFARETGQTLKAVYEDQIRLASNSLAKHYHPKTAKMGKLAILKDLQNVFIEEKPLFVMEAWAGIGGEEPARIFRTSRGAILGIEKTELNPSGDMDFMEWRHKKSRMASNGRVSTAGAKSRNIGRWKYMNRQMVPAGRVAKYAKKRVFPKVGLLKAGWLMPSESGIKNKVPNWITRAGAFRSRLATYGDHMDLFANGFLYLTNNVPYAGKHVGLLRIEIQRRQRDLLLYAGKRLDAKIAKFNAGAM